MTSLDERLARGEVILMDGGVSTEIQKHGVTMDKQIWSGTAQGRARSSWPTRRNSTASPPTGPANCTPSGSPPSLQ